MAGMDTAHRRTGLLLLGSALRVSHHAAHRAIWQWRLHLEAEQSLARSLAAREEDRESARQALGGLRNEAAAARAALGKLREDVGGELRIFREECFLALQRQMEMAQERLAQQDPRASSHSHTFIRALLRLKFMRLAGAHAP